MKQTMNPKSSFIKKKNFCTNKITQEYKLFLN